MRSASVLSRSICAALLALLLALRLIGAAGYMPAFDDGKLSIIVCPGADENAPLALNVPHHHHGHSNHTHGSCPYAAAASLGALGAAWPALLGIALFTAALLLGRKFLLPAHAIARARPPARAPPFPA
jgi:hypothetical protein